MGQVIGNIDKEPDRSVEIVLHITETLEQLQRGDLVATLENDGGIVSAEFCPLRYHLMLVRYDKDMYSSQDVLSRVKSQNINAQLVGPV